MSNRPQYVFVNENSSNVLVKNTGALQGCVISPVLFTLNTNERRSYAAFDNPLFKFADDNTIRGLINNNRKFHTDLEFLNSFSGATSAVFV